MKGHTAFRWITAVAVVACYAVIILGGNVMASDAGLGCPDWPSCHGTFSPPLSGASGIEWAHRLSAAVLSGVIVALFVAALLFERNRPVLVRLTGASLALVLAQALLGGVVVESALLVAYVLLHLALATALFALLLVIAFLSNYRDMPRRWVDWARRASEERPASGPAATGPIADPRPAVPDATAPPIA